MNFHVFFTFFMLLTSVVAVLAARKAMTRGLTYSAMTATVLSLFLLAAANAIHLLEETYWPPISEMHVSHVMELVAYSSFVALTVKTGQTHPPTNHTSEDKQ